MASLYPESQLTFSPQLAETLGVEEAILLQVLCDCARLLDADSQGEYQWFTIRAKQLNDMTPFWSPSDLHRILENLRAKGLVLIGSAPITSGQPLRFAFQGSQISSEVKSGVDNFNHPQNAPSYDSNRANRISPNWKPDESTLKMLAQNGVPREFARQHNAEFVQYWRERNEARHAWGNKFIQHIMRLWRQHESHEARMQKIGQLDFAISNKETAMTGHWRPSSDALNVLVNQAGINPNFVEDAIPEFILYWKEKQEISNTWNSRFIQHIKRQWARFEHTLQYDTEPRPITEEWQPNEDVYEVLRLANIDLEFARQRLKEFIIYWRDRNELKASWNTTFLQFIKSEWSRANKKAEAQLHDTRERSLEQDLTDRSWAE